MKKILSAALALSLAVSMMAFGSSAAGPDLAAMPASQLAYMDVYSASPEVQQAILNARAEIIYGNQAWTVNGAVSILNTETGKQEPLPEFSDVFPGWNLAEIEAAASGDPELTASVVRMTAAGKALPGYIPPETSGVASGGNIIDFKVKAQLFLFDDSAATKSFTTVTGNGNTLAVGATADPLEGSRYNLGVYCGDTHVGWQPNLKVDEAITFTAAAGRTYSIRGSVYSQDFAGWYIVRVTENLGAFTEQYPIP